MRLAACVATVLAVICETAQASPRVRYYLDQDTAAGTWQLAIRVSKGDNAGIATYGVALVGDILTLDHKSPRAGVAENFDGSLSGPMGFTVFRSPDGKANKNIGGGQDSLAPTPFLIYGYGQTAGSFQTVTNGPATPLGSNEGNNWLAKPIIASGTMTPGAWVKLDSRSALTFTTVFVSANSTATMEAVRYLDDPPFPDELPEPTAIGLATIGLIITTLVRRHLSSMTRSS